MDSLQRDERVSTARGGVGSATYDIGIGQEFDVSSTAIQSLLELDLVLDDERLAVGDEGRVEGDGDGVVSGGGLNDKSLVS